MYGRMCDVLDRRDKPSSVVGDYLSRTIVANSLKRHSCQTLGVWQARPCTGVRIWPFHLVSCDTNSSPDVSIRDACFFRFKRLCSHLAPYGGQALPATFLHHWCGAGARTFLWTLRWPGVAYAGPVLIIPQNYGRGIASPVVSSSLRASPALVSRTY